MPLQLIGTGLGDEKDLTLRAVELLAQSDHVFIESYTSIACAPTFVQNVECLAGKAVKQADRYYVEDATELLALARTHTVALLVVGDPFSATTHSDLYVRCRKEGIPVEVVHNASILNAIGITGLQLYRFGQVITLCFWTETWRPTSWFPTLLANLERGLHTLVLLDIKTKEVSDENLARGRYDKFEPPRYMGVHEAICQIRDAARESGSALVNDDTAIVAVSRLGCPTQQIRHGPMRAWLERDAAAVDTLLGGPLYSVVVPAALHPCEADHLETFASV